MPKKKTKTIKLQPSWTGPRVPAGVSHERLEQWLCNADNKCVPVAKEPKFTENINWRIFRIMSEFVEGFEFLSNLKHPVSVFGSTRTTPTNKYYQQAKKLGYLCGKAGFTMVTGGGPGMMEAANWGAFEAGGASIGLDISLPKEQRRNPYVKDSMGFHYFFTRKVMLDAAAQAYVFMPGGFGTLDELFEIMVLVQTEKMSTDVPVILMGKVFWKPLVDWITQSLADEHRFIDKKDLTIFHLVETAEEAFKIIQKTKERTL